MVKKFTVLLFLLMGICLFVNSQSAMVANVTYCSETITIDGNLDAVWETVETLPCEYTDTVDDVYELPNEGDFKGDFKLLWNENNFYVMVMMNDDYMPLAEEYEGVDEWRVDNVEVYFDPANMKTDTMDNHTQLRFEYRETPNFYRQWSEGGFAITDPVVEWQKMETATGWNLEIAFSMTAIQASVDSTFEYDHEMGFNVVCIDNDNPTVNETANVLRWVETGGDSWNHGNLMGTVTLKAEGAGINNIVNSAGITVYPNPANDYIHFSDISQIRRIEISNLIGQEVWYVDNPVSGIINVSGLKQGIYLIKLHSYNNTSTTIKISKN